MLRKVKNEMKEFYDEIVVENGPRYKRPSEWPHLFTDFWVALFDMSYTLGHLAVLAMMVWGVIKIF